ncbi:MAG: hypothetical protein AB7D26_10040, partial [Marinobacterium sp.]
SENPGTGFSCEAGSKRVFLEWIKLAKMDKEKAYKAELRKFNRLFKAIPEDKRQIVEGLKKQAAFMYATLIELQEVIDSQGVIELFAQGKQQFTREHPATKVYNSMIRNYVAVIKQLLDLLPGEEAKKTAEDELMAFIKKAK